jgi:glutaredoxin-related protein
MRPTGKKTQTKKKVMYHAEACPQTKVLVEELRHMEAEIIKQSINFLLPRVI